ncbi:MAG: FecR domain-containing protein [Polyangiaceae bacterium]
MKPESDDVRALLGALGEAPVPLEAPEREEARRKRVVSHIHKEMGRSEARVRRSPRTALLAVAAVMLFAFAGWAALRSAGTTSPPQALEQAPTEQPAEVRLTTHGVVLVDSKPMPDGGLTVGQVVSVGEQASASLVLPSDVQASLKPTTTLWVATLGPREAIYLKSGYVSVEVPKLTDGHGFSVLTPLGEVAVHGTKFSVRVTEDPPSLSVDVREGVVSVKYGGEERQLRRGESWTSATAAALLPNATASAKPPDAPSGEKEAVKAPPAAAINPRGKSDVASAETASSTLAQENALFRRAVSAEKGGDKRGALALFEQLLAKYPQSPLAPDARVRRFRILKELGDADQAAREARRYMADHPEGFAHDEARDVAGQSLKGEPAKKK